MDGGGHYNSYQAAAALAHHQVWPCLLFHAGGPIFGATKPSAFLTNAQSRFASVALYGVLEPWRLARHTWQCPCISVVPKQHTRWGWRALEGGAVSAQKALQGSETETRKLLEQQKRIVFPLYLICPTGKSIIFYLSGPPNIWVPAECLWVPIKHFGMPDIQTAKVLRREGIEIRDFGPHIAPIFLLCKHDSWATFFKVQNV